MAGLHREDAGASNLALKQPADREHVVADLFGGKPISWAAGKQSVVEISGKHALSNDRALLIGF